MYFRTPFHLPDDGFINPFYERARVNHSLEPVSTLVGRSVEPFPFHERYVSLLTHTFRSPNLPESWWRQGENANDPNEYVGIRIQLYSVIHITNYIVLYLIESTGHPIKKWKRIILTYHLSEESPITPHRVSELDPPRT
jgi:hypothetical protein